MGSQLISDWAWYLIVLLPIVAGWGLFRMPKIVFGRPENTASQEGLTWWHLPIEISPNFFQRKSIKDCSISVYIHGGGIGTIEKEINLCWRMGSGFQSTVTIEENNRYLVPVSLRSTHWTDCVVEEVRGESLIIPPRVAFLCGAKMMLEKKIPEKGLINENYFSFRVRRYGQTIGISGLYELFVPFPNADNSEFRFQTKS